ncbi:MAG: hypothetical protein P8O22_08245 [Akkermansiaceae bacterium]|jgi:hypothetical protein|nr:hypothetical protein [Akkermansiaceae bacterium]
MEFTLLSPSAQVAAYLRGELMAGGWPWLRKKRKRWNLFDDEALWGAKRAS